MYNNCGMNLCISLLIRKVELHNPLCISRTAQCEKARGIHTGLMWGGPYRSAQLKFMWGRCGVNHLGPYGLTHMGPRGAAHMGPCMETHMGLPGLSLCVAHIGYILWDCPLGSHTEPMWGSPYGLSQLKLT